METKGFTDFIQDILVVLKGRFNHYIYISSDSVYEVCQEKQHDGANRENDAIRPGGNKLRYVMILEKKATSGLLVLNSPHQ